jgi:hypothetical protein
MFTERKADPSPTIGPLGEIPRTGLDDMVLRLARESDLDQFVGEDRAFFPAFMKRLERTIESGLVGRQARALYEIHRALYVLYELNFAAPDNPQAANQFHPFLLRVRNDIERAWERAETSRAQVTPSDVPGDPVRFSADFKDRCARHRLARHPLFDFLEFKATRAELIEFFMHDRALILRFCDLVSMAMVGADDEVRGELAVNLWDEMGNGDPAMRHTALFRRLLSYIGCEADRTGASTEPYVGILDWPGFAGYNLHLFFSLHRRNYFKSVGCLGSAELMDGNQYAKILRGCHRVGLDDAEQLAYYASHVEIDASHGETWLANVLVPLVVKYPEARVEIAVGAEMRLNITADYYDSLLQKLLALPRRRVVERQSVASVAPVTGHD